MKESKIYGIQLLRVLACLGVIGVHLSLYVTLPIMIAKIWQFGSQGPYFFFILSGYLMMSSRDLEKGDWKKYYQKRLFRILPTYYVVLFGYFIAYVIGEINNISSLIIESRDGVWTWKWLRYVFCVNLILPTDENVWRNLGAFWSVSCFLAFYLLAPFLHRMAKSLKTTLVVFVLLMILSAVWEKVTHLPGTLVSSLPYFATGILVYNCRESEKRTYNFIFILVCGLIGMFSYGVPLRFIAWDIMLIILLSMKYYSEDLKQLRIVQYLDKRSYGLYLIHPFAMLLSSAIAEYVPMGNMARFIFIIILIILLTEIEYQCENIVRRAGK